MTLTPRKPIDVVSAKALLDSAAEHRSWYELNGEVWAIGRDRFYLADSYMAAMDFIRSEAAGNFAVSFARQLGCEILFLETGTFSTPEEFAEYLRQSKQMTEDRARRAKPRKSESDQNSN